MVEKNKGGRPTLYTTELADRICEQIALGRAVISICKEDWCVDNDTIYHWIARNTEFADKYAKAKESSALVHAEKIVTIPDEEPERDEQGKIDPAWVNLQRLRVDARKWTASKLQPKKYGDKQFTEHSGTLSLEQLMAQTVAPKKEEDRS